MKKPTKFPFTTLCVKNVKKTSKINSIKGLKLRWPKKNKKSKERPRKLTGSSKRGLKISNYKKYTSSKCDKFRMKKLRLRRGNCNAFKLRKGKRKKLQGPKKSGI